MEDDDSDDDEDDARLIDEFTHRWNDNDYMRWRQEEQWRKKKEELDERNRQYHEVYETEHRPPVHHHGYGPENELNELDDDQF